MNLLLNECRPIQTTSTSGVIHVSQRLYYRGLRGIAGSVSSCNMQCCCPRFGGKKDRPKAEVELNGRSDGTFMVRESANRVGEFALSIRSVSPHWKLDSGLMRHTGPGASFGVTPGSPIWLKQDSDVRFCCCCRFRGSCKHIKIQYKENVYFLTQAKEFNGIQVCDVSMKTVYFSNRRQGFLDQPFGKRHRVVPPTFNKIGVYAILFRRLGNSSKKVLAHIPGMFNSSLQVNILSYSSPPELSENI